MLIAAVNLLYVVDSAYSLSRHGGDEKSHTGTDVGRCHVSGSKWVLASKTDNGGPVRVAEYNLGSHIDEFIDKEEAALEHLLVDKHAASGLYGCDKGYTYQVGCESWPWCVRDGEYGSVHETVYLIHFMGWDVEVVAALPYFDAQTAENLWYETQMFNHYIFNRDVALGHGGHAYETSHLNHVGKQPVGGASKVVHTLDGQTVAAHAADAGTHPVEHLAELIDVWLAGGIHDGCGTFGTDGSHNDIGGTRDAGLVNRTY